MTLQKYVLFNSIPHKKNLHLCKVYVPPPGLPDFTSLHQDKLLAQGLCTKKPDSPRRIAGRIGFCFAPLFDERCSYNAMIEYVTVRKLKG